MTDSLRNRIMCCVTHLPKNFLSQLALWKSNWTCWSSTRQTSSSSHWNVTCSHQDTVEKLLTLRKTTISHILLKVTWQNVSNVWSSVWLSRSGELHSIQHYVIKFVSDLRQVGGFLLVLRFPPPIKLTSRI